MTERRNVIRLKLPSGGGGLGRGRLGVLVAVIGVVGVVLAGLLSISQKVAPDQFAVRQVYFGPSKGVQQGTYGPGLHVVVPGYERLHVFPQDLQVLDLNDDELAYVQKGGQIPPDYRAAPSIRITTSEGYQVTVDVTMLYRVADPYAVVTKVGPGRIYESKVVQRQADTLLRQTLGRLDAEDFYDDERRVEATNEAKRLLGEDLAQWGVELLDVLIREYTYDARYQEAIEQRKIQDQTVFKNKAEAIAATQAAEKDRVLAEGRANIAVEMERGRAEVRKIAAEADLYFRQQVAGGDLQVSLAEAEGTRLENAALQSAGASNMVGLRMAEAMKGTQVIVVSTTGAGAVNPLDLERLISGW